MNQYFKPKCSELYMYWFILKMHQYIYNSKYLGFQKKKKNKVKTCLNEIMIRSRYGQQQFIKQNSYIYVIFIKSI